MTQKRKKYDLVIAYRIYPKLSGYPPVYDDNKYLLAKLCLKSLKDCLGNLKVKIFALLDNCPKEYEKLFQNYFNTEDLEMVRLKGIGNYGTFELALDILTRQNDSNVVYFAEDDYLYLPNQFHKMVSFLKSDPEANFIHPYDHLDHYIYHFHNYKSKIKIHEGLHWRTIHSACCTFLTSKELLKKTKEIFRIYMKGTILLTSWICLTKYKVYHPFKILRYYFHDKRQFRYYFTAWRYGWRQILFGVKWNLWCPIPSIATHMNKYLLAPSIDWERLIDDLKKDL